MADLAVTVAQVMPTRPTEAKIRTRIAAAAITVGQAVYINSAGKVDLADANSAGKEQVDGIALTKAAAGQQVDVQIKGEIAGFDLSGVAYGAPVYLSDTAGSLNDTASGTKTVRVGRCVPRSDSDLTKVLDLDINQTTNW